MEGPVIAMGSVGNTVIQDAVVQVVHPKGSMEHTTKQDAVVQVVGPEGSTEQTLEQDAVAQVVLPDMFLLFLAQSPRVNPHYENIRRESEAWLLKHERFDARISNFVHHTDFSYFCAVVLPDASAEALRTLCDWGNWVFPFDDGMSPDILEFESPKSHQLTSRAAFDNGHLKTNPDEARKLIEGLVSIMSDQQFDPKHPLLIAFRSIWLRLCHTSSKGNYSTTIQVTGLTMCTGVQARFATSMTAYCEAIMRQVHLQSTAGLTSTVDELLVLRRDSIATTPIYAFIEYAYGLAVPAEVMEHPVIHKLQKIVTDIVLIQNDIVSYAKEKALGESHNIISVYQLQGKSLQSSFDCAGELLKSRYREWYLALTELPTWGEDIDSQVQVHINSVQNVAVANLNWSFRAERYWSGNNGNVRKSRTITLPVQKVATAT